MNLAPYCRNRYAMLLGEVSKRDLARHIGGADSGNFGRGKYASDLRDNRWFDMALDSLIGHAVLPGQLVVRSFARSIGRLYLGYLRDRQATMGAVLAVRIGIPRNRRTGNPVALGKFPVGCLAGNEGGLDFRNLRVGQLGLGVPLSVAYTTGRTSLLPHVRIVVGNCTEKKVIGADARGVVAFVANNHPRGDGAIMYLPRYTMRHQRRAAVAASVNNAVTKITGCASPQPTRIGFLDIIPETLFKRNAFAVSHE